MSRKLECFVKEPLDRLDMPSCGKKVVPYWGILSGEDLADLRDDVMAIWIQRKKWLKDNNKWNQLEYKLRKNQFYRRFQEEKEERMLQQCICKVERDKCHRERQIIQEENFAEAMKDLKEDDVRDAAFRKQLYACAPEIRELEHELRRAYYAKTLHAQRLENEAKILEEKMQQHEMHEFLKENLANWDAKEAEKEAERQKQKCEYRKELENQLNEATSKASKQKTESEQDKEMVDEILETIKKEEIDDLVEKVNKVKLYQSEITNFLEAREKQREQERARQQKELERDATYLNTKEEQKAAFNEAKAARDKAKSEIVAKAIRQMMAVQFEAEELEDLRRELYEEELAESVRTRDAEEKEKKYRTMIQLREAEAEAKLKHAEKLAAEKEEDDKFKLQLMLKFAEDDRLEQMGASKRRQREREHRKKVEEMVATNRALRAQEREKELEVRHCADEEEKRRQDLIDLERQKLLREHGTNLIGFIPCGTIKSQEELEKLGEPFLTYYRNGAQFRAHDPSTIDFSPCEEELFKNMEVPKNSKY